MGDLIDKFVNGIKEREANPEEQSLFNDFEDFILNLNEKKLKILQEKIRKGKKVKNEKS